MIMHPFEGTGVLGKERLRARKRVVRHGNIIDFASRCGHVYAYDREVAPSAVRLRNFLHTALRKGSDWGSVRMASHSYSAGLQTGFGGVCALSATRFHRV